MKHKVLLFDMDGTLIDAQAGINKCLSMVQRTLGLRELTKEEMLSFIGPPLEHSYRRVLNMSEQEANCATELFSRYIHEGGYKDAEFYKGIEEMIKSIRGHYDSVGIVTLKNQISAQKIIAHKCMDEYFDIIIGKTDGVDSSKAELVQMAIEQLGADKLETLLIGDSEFDAIGAMQAGIDFFAVTYGFGFKGENALRNYAHIDYADTVEELQSKLTDKRR